MPTVLAALFGSIIGIAALLLVLYCVLRRIYDRRRARERAFRYGQSSVNPSAASYAGTPTPTPGAGPGGTQLQLLAPTTPGSPVARFLERSGPGLQQLAYRVADVEEAARVLRARGLRLIYDRARTGTQGSRVNFVHPRDAGGVLVELVQPSPGG